MLAGGKAPIPSGVAKAMPQTGMAPAGRPPEDVAGAPAVSSSGASNPPVVVQPSELADLIEAARPVVWQGTAALPQVAWDLQAPGRWFVISLGWQLDEPLVVSENPTMQRVASIPDPNNKAKTNAMAAPRLAFSQIVPPHVLESTLAQRLPR